MKMLLSVIAIMFAFIFSSGTVHAESGFGNMGLQVREYVYDFAVDGGTTGFKDLTSAKNNPLPQGALVLAVSYEVVTAFTSGGSATVSIGNVTTVDDFKAATAFDNATYAIGYVASNVQTVGTKVTTANLGKFGINIATAALTAGKVKFFVMYLVPKS